MKKYRAIVIFDIFRYLGEWGKKIWGKSSICICAEDSNRCFGLFYCLQIKLWNKIWKRALEVLAEGFLAVGSLHSVLLLTFREGGALCSCFELMGYIKLFMLHIFVSQKYIYILNWIDNIFLIYLNWLFHILLIKQCNVEDLDPEFPNLRIKVTGKIRMKVLFIFHISKWLIKVILSYFMSSHQTNCRISMFPKSQIRTFNTLTSVLLFRCMNPNSYSLIQSAFLELLEVGEGLLGLGHNVGATNYQLQSLQSEADLCSSQNL